MNEKVTPAEIPETSQLWHLHWQAAVGREFLVSPLMHVRIRQRLLAAHRKPGLCLLDYTILPTEIHVLNATFAGMTPGVVARSVGNVISRWVREVKRLRSPLLAAPCFLRPIQSLSDLRQEIRMLAWRPVRLGLVSLPSQYTRAGLSVALGMVHAEGFDVRPIHSLYGKTVSTARAALRKHLRLGPFEQQWREWELSCQLVLAGGSLGPHAAGFRPVEGAAAALVAASATGDIVGALRLLEAWVSTRLDPGEVVDLRQRQSPQSARGRAVVASLAVTHGLCPAASVARYFGFAKATLSEQMALSRGRTEDRRFVSTDASQLLREVSTQPSFKRLVL